MLAPRPMGVLALLVFLASSAAAGSNKLKLRYERGGHYHLRAERSFRVTAPDTPSMAQRSSEELEAEIEETLRGEVLRLKVERLKLKARQSGVDVDVAGESESRKLRLDFAFDHEGPLDAGRVNSKAFDGAAWGRVASIAELLRSVAIMGLPRLDAGSLEVGDVWSGERKSHLAVPGAPEMEMKLSSRYRVLARVACGGRACLRIREDLDMLGSQQRAWRAMNVQLDADGKGRAVHLFDVERGQLVRSEVNWKVKVELRQIFSATAMPLHTMTELTLSVDKRS